MSSWWLRFYASEKGGIERLRLCRRPTLISREELPSLGRESLVSSLTCEGIPIQGKFHAAEGKASTA